MVTTEQTTDGKKNKKVVKENHKNTTNDNTNIYGRCRWSDELMIDKKGSNCPEYLFIRMFMKGLFK